MAAANGFTLLDVHRRHERPVGGRRYPSYQSLALCLKISNLDEESAQLLGKSGGTLQGPRARGQGKSPGSRPRGADVETENRSLEPLILHPMVWPKPVTSQAAYDAVRELCGSVTTTATRP